MSLIKRIAFLSLLTGAAVLVGWCFSIKILQSVVPGLVTMKVNAAVCFVLLGWALLTNRQVIYRLLLVLVIIISGITLFEYQSGWNAPIDPLVGRMAFNTALSFTLLGLGLLGLSIGKFRAACQYFLHAVTVLAGIAIMGYVYGVSMFYSFAYVSSMAIHTAVLLLLVSIAAAMLNSDLGVARLFMGAGMGNRMARRHFTTMMLVLVIFGSLRIQSERFHLLPPAVGIALLAISLLLTSLIMIWITANGLNKAEEEIRQLNTSLEVKVEKTEAKYQSLFEHASDAIYVLSRSGDFIDVNVSTCQLTGYSRDELLQLNITALLEADALAGYQLLFTVIEPGTSVIAERQIITKDGNLVDIEINLKRFIDERILVIARDITSRKEAEQSILAHIAQINEMTWKQSHLIRSPLANLKGLFPMIKADPADQTSLTYAESELERMDQILFELAEGTKKTFPPTEQF